MSAYESDMPAYENESSDVLEAATGDRQTRQSDSVSALERGFMVLNCFAPEVVALGNQEFARITGLPKATVSRITQTLTKLGYLEYSAVDGKYRLTAAVMSLGRAYLANIDVRKVARPFMADLADHAQASVHMGVRNRTNMVVVESCRPSTAVVALGVSVGFLFPIASTASGGAYMAAVSGEERERMLARLKEEYPDDWERHAARLQRNALEYERKGFCTILGGWHENVNAVAVPIRPAGGQDVMAITCGGPSFLLSAEAIEQDIGPRLLEVARRIEFAIGYPPEK